MTEFKDLETKINNEEMKANELLKKLKAKLKEIDERFLREQESKSSADLINAKKLLAGIEVADIGRPLADFQVQRRYLLTAIKLQTNEIQKIVSKRRIQLKMLRPWGTFSVGDEVLFDPRKGNPLIEKKFAVKVERTLKENPIIREKRSNQKMLIRLKLLKNWGGFGAGSVVDFGESKGYPLIDSGVAVEVSKKEKKVIMKAGRKKPKVENIITEPVAETAEVAPVG